MIDFYDKIIYCIFILFIIGIIFVLRKVKRGSTFNGIIFGVLVYYLVVPFMFLLNVDIFSQYESLHDVFGRTTINDYLINVRFSNYLMAIFLTFISIVSFFIAYNYTKEKQIIIRKQIIKIKIIKIISYFCFFVGGLSLFIFFYKFGGVREALKYAEYLRSFSTNTSDIIGSYDILFIPARLITVTPFLFLFLYRENGISKRNTILYLVISVTLSLLFYMYNAGRAPLIFFLICLIYPSIRKKTKFAWLLIIVSGIILLPLLDLLDSLFIFFDTGVFTIPNISYVNYIYQMIYPFRNIVNVLSISKISGYRYGIDFVTSIIGLLPGLEFSASYEDTSLFINGANWKIYGGIPNDAITFGFIEFGIIGVILLFIFLGIVARKIDLRIDNLEDNINKFLLSGIVTVYSFLIIINADFVSLIRGGMILYIIIFVIFSYYKKVDIK